MSRRELHGLTSGTTVHVKYTLAVTYESAGVIIITSTASNPSLSLTISPSGAGSETAILEGTYQNLISTYIYLNLTVTCSMNCTVQITTFELTVTQPS